MKVLLVVVLVALLLAIGLPLGMGDMTECPTCTTSQSLLLGLCLAVALVFLVVPSNLVRSLGSYNSHHRLQALFRAIYRPPRFA